MALPRILERTAELLREVISEATAIAAHDSQPPIYHFAKEVLNLTERHVELLTDARGAKV